MDPPLASVTARFLRIHMLSTEGIEDVPGLAFALCNANTSNNVVPLTYKQEVSVLVSQLVTGGAAHGVPQQIILMVMLPRSAGKYHVQPGAFVPPSPFVSPRNPFATPTPNASASSGHLPHGSSGAGGGGGGGGSVGGSSICGDGGGSSTGSSSSSDSSRFKAAKASNEGAVARKVEALGGAHSSLYINKGVAGLLLHLKPTESNMSKRAAATSTWWAAQKLGTQSASKPKALAQHFVQHNKSFYGVWKDQDGVKIGCVACAMLGKNLSDAQGHVAAATFRDPQPSAAGIFMAGTEVHGIGNFKKHLGGATHGKGVRLYLQERSAYQREQRRICEEVLSDLTQSGHGTQIFGIRVKAGEIASGHALECTVCSKRDAQLGEVAFPFSASARTDNILAHCRGKSHRSRVRLLSTTASKNTAIKSRRGTGKKKADTLYLQTNSINSYYAKGKSAIDDEGGKKTKKANGDGDEEGGKKTKRANSDGDEDGGKNKKQKKKKIKKKQTPEDNGTTAPKGEDSRDPDGSSPGAGDAVPDGGTGGPSAGDAGAGNTGRGESQRNEGGGGKDDGAGDAGERKEGGDAGDADGGDPKQMQIQMDALDSLGDSALEGTLMGLGKHKSREVTAIAGVPGGACAGFWFRSIYARNRQQGRQHLAACAGQDRLVVYDEAYEHTASTFIGKSANAHVVTVVRQTGDVTVRGTFHSTGKHTCAQFSKPKETFPNGMCASCARLEHSKPLRRWVQKNMMHHAKKKAEAEAELVADPKCNNQYLTTFEREQKMATIASSLEAAHRRGDCLENEVAALKSTPVDVVKELMTHHAKDSIEVAVCAKLLVAQKKNLITPEHKNLLSIMKDQCKNMTRKPGGFRHGDASKSMSGVLSITYGQNCPKWLAKNVWGPSSRTIRRHLPQAKFKGGYEDTVQIVTQAKSMYQRLMSEHNLKPGSVACYLAEDETSIQAEASCNQGADAIVGFCGKIENDDGKAHECTLDGHCYIGCGGQEAYERILEAMTTSMVGNNGRCIMFVPLHRKLPAMVVLLATTCNRFSAEGYVGPQWTAVSKICNEVLGDVVGHVIGHASDGDGRRRHLMTKIGSPGMARETQAEILVAVHARADRMEAATACLRFEPTTGCAG